MFNVLAISQSDTEQLLDMETIIEKVELAYQLKYREEASLWPMIFHEFEPGVADMDIKSGHLLGAGIFGLKLVSWFGPNAQKNLPQLVGTVMVYDASTGAPKAILSAEHITSMRTGAAGAIGAKYLARKDSKTLLMVGTGHQALYQIAATLMVMPELKKVYLYNPRNIENAKNFKNSIAQKLKDQFLVHYKDDSAKFETYKNAFNVDFEVVTDIEQATKESDIIITATPSHEPMIMRNWVKPGTHFSCVGADMGGKQEIDTAILAEARIYTDDITQSINVGEVENAYKSGLVKKSDIIAEIGEIIETASKGRVNDTDITVFDSTGIALQDLIAADYAIEQAKIRKMGTEFDL